MYMEIGYITFYLTPYANFFLLCYSLNMMTSAPLQWTYDLPQK